MSIVETQPRDERGAAASGTLVRAEQLTCVFDVSRPWLERTLSGAPKQRLTAVAGISFAIERRETFALVGESGSGKSVIAQAVMGLLPKALPVTGGEIFLEGEDIANASEDRLRDLRCVRMSMIFQEPMTALNPVMTCGEQIEEVLREHTPLSAAERRAKVLAIVREVRLPEPERMIASRRC